MQTSKSYFQMLLISMILLFVGERAIAQATPFVQAIDRFVQDASMKGATVGFSLIDLDTGNEVAGFQSDQVVIPASILKLWTTGAALHYLGPDFRFKTEILHNGQIENGILKGDIILKGYGDPSLGSKYNQQEDLGKLLQIIISQIKQAGIQVVQGNIIGDGSFLKTPPESPQWTWMDLGNYYAAGAWGLNFADNEYDLTFKQQILLESIPPITKIDPSFPGMTIINEVTSASASSGDNAYIYGAPYQLQRTVRGTIPVGKGMFSIKGSMPDPPKFAAHQIKKALEGAGISISGEALSHREVSPQASHPTELKLIYEHKSPPLSQLITVINKRSNNTYAEALFRYIGQLKEPGGDLYQSAVEIESWIELLGTNSSNQYVVDGSGLSRHNGVTSLGMARSLYGMSKEGYFDAFYASLPIPGEVGTLRNTFTSMPALSSLKAKSGTLSRVKSFAGYLNHSNGKRYAFVIICNQFGSKSTEISRKIETLLYDLARS